MTRPSEPVPIPAVVADIAAGRSAVAVWVNELGGVTFEIDGGREFVKVAPAQGTPAGTPHLVAEADRLTWAVRYLRVPRVLAAGEGWLHTEGLGGRSAVDPHWVARPRTAARAIGDGLRTLHDALPVEECPFGAPPWVTDTSPGTDPVVCHGDACAPNTLIGDDGRCAGHVDLGELGVADRWADLAIALLSLSWNYPGEVLEDDLLDAYGIERDAARIGHFQRLWEAGDISSR